MLIRNKTERPRSIEAVGHEPILVEAGESAEVDETLGASLLDQPDVWGPAGPTNVDVSIPAVLAQVGDDKDRARTALEKEQATDKPRKSLVDSLTKIIES